MNIHINKELFDFIMASTKSYKFVIGSKMYGIDDETSGTDYLIIYHPFMNQLLNPFSNIHQLQYKDLDSNIDYNLVDLITFIKNLVSGDSTINYELINNSQLVGTDLEFLYDLKESFKTFNIAKSYLGFAKRDVNHFSRRTTHKDRISGLLHIERSYKIAEYIMGINNSNLDDIYSYLKEVKRVNLDDTKISFYKKIIDDLRTNLTSMHNENKLVKYLDVELQTLISNKLLEITKVSNEIIPMNMFFFHNENIEFKY